MKRNASEPAFERTGVGRFVATDAAAGPWDSLHCHGGAPAGLVAGLIEAGAEPDRRGLARFSFALLRPLAIGRPFEVRFSCRHQGRSVGLIDAETWMEDRLIGTARALQVRRLPPQSLPPMGPEPSAVQHRAMPGRFSEGFTIVPVSGGLGQAGPADAWFRMDRPLANDLQSPAAAVVAAADFGSGIANDLPFEQWRFPSLDLSVSLVRPPAGEWVRLQSRWLAISEGRTTCLTVLSDRHGDLGHASQTVMIEPRAHQ